MKRIFTSILLLFFACNFLNADSTEERFLSSASSYVATMKDYTNVSHLVNNAKAILIYPSVKKIGFVVGGMHGKGVALVKSGSTFRPYYSELNNGSFGFQIGYEDNTIVMFVMSENILNDMLSSNLTLGADATASIGTASANLGSLDVFSRKIYTFMNKSGVFAGVSLSGVIVTIDTKKPYNTNNVGYNTLLEVINKR